MHNETAATVDSVCSSNCDCATPATERPAMTVAAFRAALAAAPALPLTVLWPGRVEAHGLSREGLCCLPAAGVAGASAGCC